MRRLDQPPAAPSSYRHILVAVDTPGASDQAVRLALALAHGDPEARVTFCHVLDVPRMIARTFRGLGDYAAEFNAAREAARATLEPFMLLAHQRGIAAQKCVRYGHPATELASFAQLIRADLIVVGNRPATALQRLLRAGTRDELVRVSSVPVVIADGEELRAVRFRPQCILMTGDADRVDAERAKLTARSFAHAFAARLVLSPAIDAAVREYRPGLIVVPRPRRRTLRDLFGADPIERILRSTHIPVMVTGGVSAGGRA